MTWNSLSSAALSPQKNLLDIRVSSCPFLFSCTNPIPSHCPKGKQDRAAAAATQKVGNQSVGRRRLSTPSPFSLENVAFLVTENWGNGGECWEDKKGLEKDRVRSLGVSSPFPPPGQTGAGANGSKMARNWF